jgi:lipopolysaccharide transport system permease protein
MISSTRSLLYSLVQRNISARYRGSALGMLWPLLTPLFMLAVYTFVFGTIFKARWAIPGREGDPHSTGEFAIILFAGLIVFQILSETLLKAPSAILSNSSYVKKVVFPIEILPLVPIGAALFHALISFLVLLVFQYFIFGGIPLTALWLPVVLLPFVMMMAGFGWFFAAIGVYVRDIPELLGPAVTALMFLSPIFFPKSAMPDWLQLYHYLNPVALPVEMTRDVLIFGMAPDMNAFSAYLVAALLVLGLGHMFFQMVRKGFADVL